MNQEKPTSFRSTLGKVRFLGSAKSGTYEWYLMRLSAAALLLLALYPLFGFFIYAVYGGREGAIAWLHSPIAATGVILFLAVGFYHAAHGLQVVIEDYVHCAIAKPALLFVVKFGMAAFAVLGALAVVKIFLTA